MEQLNIFGEAGQSSGLPSHLLDYRPAFFNEQESFRLLHSFIHNTPWLQETIHLYGKTMKTPRLTAWYGNNNSIYQFSGNKYHPLPWTDDLLHIKSKIEAVSGVTFNSVLLNYYRDGNDSVAWHSDDEPELGTNPLIASVSFGQVRRFDIRHKQDHQQKYAVNLENGSLLIMQGDLQHNWEHRIAKSTKPMRERVNLTFRMIN